MKKVDEKGREKDLGNRVWVANRQRRVAVDRERIEGVAVFVLDAMGLKDAELSVVLLSDRGICKLNRQYLERNRPTDVLAFSQREGEGGDLYPCFLGDVVISVETAAQEAKQRGVSLNQELDTLLVHGVLHLLGHEHTRGRQEAARMNRKQKVILQKVRQCFVP